jgi:hypothetical protein
MRFFNKKKPVITEPREDPIAHSAPSTLIEKELTEFFDGKNRRTLLVKGGWGTGKTHAVRGFLSSEQGLKKIPTFSYTSLSGVDKVGDERDLVFSGIERVNGQAIPPLMKTLGQAAAKGTSEIPWFGPVLAALGTLESEVAPLRNALIILDDLERARYSALPSIFGAISRLSELRETYVWVLVNEDQLTPAGQNFLAQRKEKLFDAEITFHPSASECLNLLFGDTSPSALNSVITTLRINNLRIIRKVDWIISDVGRLLESLHTRSEPRELIIRQTAIIAALHYRATERLQASHLTESAAVISIKEIEGVRSKNPFRDDLLSLEFFPLNFVQGTRTLDSWEGTTLKTIVDECQALTTRAAFHQAARTVMAGFNNKFSCLDPEEVNTVQRIVTDFLPELGIRELRFWLKLLKSTGHGQDAASIERRWVKNLSTALKKLSDDDAQFLADSEAKALLKEKLICRTLSPTRLLIRVPWSSSIGWQSEQTIRSNLIF